MSFRGRALLSETEIRQLAENSAASAFRAMVHPPTNEEFERMWQLIANAIMCGMTPRQATERAPT